MFHKKVSRHELNKKILVCITPQSNSKRLIDYAYDISKKNSGELYILHVEKGNNIFMRTESSAILQELFDYGSELGGVVHAVCGEDITDTIQSFVKEQEITCIVLGEPPENAINPSNSIIEKLNLMMPYLKIEILKRETDADKC